MSYPTLNYKYDYNNKISKTKKPDLYTKVGNFINFVTVRV